MNLENLKMLAEFVDTMSNKDSKEAFKKESDNAYDKARDAFKTILKYSNTSYEEILSLMDCEDAKTGLEAFILGTFYPVYSFIGEDIIAAYIPIFKFFEAFIKRIKRLETVNTLLSETLAEEVAKEN